MKAKTQSDTGIDKLVDIEYTTKSLEYDQIRTKVLQNRDKLIEMGYKCAWNGDLDLTAQENPSERQKRGYIDLSNVIITALEKDGLVFTITIYPKRQRAKISGNNHKYQTELDQTRQQFDKFEETTGIHLRLTQTSEPYSAGRG